jgi:hypothetical protein
VPGAFPATRPAAQQRRANGTVVPLILGQRLSWKARLEREDQVVVFAVGLGAGLLGLDCPEVASRRETRTGPPEQRPASEQHEVFAQR